MLLPHLLLYVSLEVQGQQLQFDGGKKLRLVIPDCFLCELVLGPAAYLLEPGKTDKFL